MCRIHIPGLLHHLQGCDNTKLNAVVLRGEGQWAVWGLRWGPIIRPNWPLLPLRGESRKSLLVAVEQRTEIHHKPAGAERAGRRGFQCKTKRSEFKVLHSLEIRWSYYWARGWRGQINCEIRMEIAVCREGLNVIGWSHYCREEGNTRMNKRDGVYGNECKNCLEADG